MTLLAWIGFVASFATGVFVFLTWGRDSNPWLLLSCVGGAVVCLRHLRNSEY